MNSFLSQFFNLFKIISPLSILVVLIATQTYFSQDNPRDQNGCNYIAKEKPSVFISYERGTIKQNGKAENTRQILLRLHNNSSCKIIVETTTSNMNDESLYKKEVNHQSNGDTITKYIPNPPKDFELPISYDIQESSNKAFKPGNYWEDRHLVFNYPIPSGHSAIFPVDVKYFRKQFSISISFEYEWEDSSELKTWGTISHRVFYVYDLPQGFFK